MTDMYIFVYTQLTRAKRKCTRDREIKISEKPHASFTKRSLIKWA